MQSRDHLDGERLVGIVPLTRLLEASPGIVVADLMDPAPPTVTPDEDQEGVALIAFLLPAVVYIADAVGTQTEALMIRALAVGASRRKAIRREPGRGRDRRLSLAVSQPRRARSPRPRCWCRW